MKIFRAIGLGLVIIVLRLLMPDVFGAFEDVLLKFFTLLGSVLSFASDSFADGSFLPASVLMPQIPHQNSRSRAIPARLCFIGIISITMKRYRTYLPDFIFGSIDGLVTTFAIVSGVIGASLSTSVILILGFANLFADGFSMAVSNYLSSKSNEDLGNGTTTRKPTMAALVTFLSFVAVGFVPLIAFIINFETSNFFLASLLTAIAFLWVGYVKGAVTNTNKFSAALQTLLIGALAAVIAYIVGYLLSGLEV